MCATKSQHGLPVEIHLAFRVNRPFEDVLTDPPMDEFRRPEVSSITGTNTFANWGGLVRPEDVPSGIRIRQISDNKASIQQMRKDPCYEYYMNPVITADGLLRTCACANPEAPELVLGNVKTTSLRDIWLGDAMLRFRNSFGTDAIPNACTQCSAYQNGEVWLHNPSMSSFRLGDDPWDIVRVHSTSSAGAEVSQALAQLAAQGAGRLALYGAGRFTREALKSGGFKPSSYPVLAIVDDNPDLAGTDVAGIPVVSSASAIELGVDGVVISSQWYEAELWDAAMPLRNAGVRCVRLSATPATDFQQSVIAPGATAQ